jgi:beta-lactamase regulating signal transducer with metallopeptidase domain
MMLAVLLESSVRTFVLGLTVWGGLKIFRVKSVHAQLTIWTFVLLAAMSMPLLMQRTTVTLTAPPVAATWIARPAVPSTATTVVSQPLATPAGQASQTDWTTIVLGAYATIATVLFVRLLLGLALTYHVRSRSMIIAEEWTAGLDVRSSSAVRAPVTFGSTILLPDDFRSWPDAKRDAVLLHERSHAQRADFYLQVLGGVHRAIFWFSPFAWWLQNRLIELGELASDDAAIDRMPNRAAYAEILVELAKNRPRSLFAGASMARPSTIARRIERILTETAVSPALGFMKRMVLVLGIVPVVALVSGFALISQAQIPLSPPTPAVAAAVSPVVPALAPSPAVVGTPPARLVTRTAPQRSTSDNDEFVIISSGRQSGFASDRASRQAESLRDKIQGDYVWFERDGKAYYITDSRIVQRAKDIVRPQEELGRRQAALAEQQAFLGQRQASLGEEQTKLAISMPDLTRNIDQLRSSVAAAMGKELQQAVIRVQAEIAALQASLNDLQVRASVNQAQLGQEQAKLGETQAQLGQEQAVLGQQQAQLAVQAASEIRTLIDDALRNGQARPVQ